MSSEAPPTDPAADAAALEAKAAKDLKKKQKMQARQEEMRRKVLEDAKSKAAARISKETEKANDDDEEDDSVLTEEHVAWLEELKLLPGSGRKPDSFPMPTGITRRLTPLEYAFYLNAIMGKTDEENEKIVTLMNDPAHVPSELASLRATAMEGFKKKAYKGKSGASLEAKIAKNESRARKLYKTVVKQFVVLKRSASTVMTNLAEAVEYMRIGLFELDRGDDVSKDTFLHSACREGEWDVAQWLLAHGASVDARNDRGETPLYLCAVALAEGGDRAAGAYECLWGVLERGGDPDAKTAEGKSARDVCAGMGPPVELDAVWNMLLLRVRSRGEWEKHISWWAKGEGEWSVSGIMPRAQVLKLAMKEYKMRRMQEQQARIAEEERLAAEAELAKQKEEEEKAKAKKEKLELKKKGKIIWATASERLKSMFISASTEHADTVAWLGAPKTPLEALEDDYDDVANEYALVRLICDPNLTKMFHTRAIDASAQLSFLPASALELAAATEHALAVGALLGCGADPNVYREQDAAADGVPQPLLMRVLRRVDALVAAGEAIDGEKARLLLETCSRLIEAGAATTLVRPGADAAAAAESADGDAAPASSWVAASDDASVAHARASLQSAPVVAWVEKQFRDGDHQQPYNDSKKRRVLAAMLVLIEAYEENERRNIEDHQSRLKQKKRRARELAQKQAALTAQLQQSTAEAEAQATQDVESLAKQLQEQEERARQEALEAESLLQARLARGKKGGDQGDMYEKAMKLAALQFAQTESEEAQAAAAMAEKLKNKGKKSKQEREAEEKARAEGEELLRQQQTEKEELQEELEPAGLLDASLFSAFTMMDLSEAVPEAMLQALHKDLTRPTVLAMGKTLHEFKYHRESHKGMDGRVLESLLELGYDHATGKGAWAGVKALDEMIDASIAERKILRKFQSQGSSFSKKALREIGRRLAMLEINARIYEDLLRRVYVLYPDAVVGEVAAEQAGKEWAVLENKIAEIGAKRDEEELAIGYQLFSPSLASVAKGTLSRDLLALATPLLVSLEAAFESVHAEDQDELPVDLGLKSRLESSPPVWELEGYLQRQLAWTDGTLRELREAQIACKAKLGPDTSAAERAEVEGLVARLRDQMAPLDVQHDLYMQLLGAIATQQQKAYGKLSQPDQALWVRCWAQHEDGVKAAIAQQETQRAHAAERGQTGGASALDRLLARVQAAHEDDWTRAEAGAGKAIETTEGRVGGVVDDDLDGGWISNRDFTNIDADIVEDLEVLTEEQALRYLATKLAENEGRHAFLRRYHQHSPSATAAEADYAAWLDRRYPMYQHLFHQLLRLSQPLPASVPRALDPYDPAHPPARHTHAFPLLSAPAVDLDLHRASAARAVVAAAVHDATVAPVDWAALREQLAAEQWLRAVTALHTGALRGLPSGTSGGLHSRALGSAPCMEPAPPPPRWDDANEVSRAGLVSVLVRLHRQLHAECHLSEDVVEMVVASHAAGLAAASVVPLLHALHVACARDTHVRWDAAVAFPHPAMHPAADTQRWGAWPVPRAGVLAPCDAARVFLFNDDDVRGAAWGRFLARTQAGRRKQDKERASEFPVCGLAIPLPRVLCVVAGEEAEEAEVPRRPTDPLPVLPVLGSSAAGAGRRDAYADEVRYGLAVSDRKERVGVGYWDLRDELVVAPQHMRYAPRGWQ